MGDGGDGWLGMVVVAIGDVHCSGGWLVAMVVVAMGDVAVVLDWWWLIGGGGRGGCGSGWFVNMGDIVVVEP